MAEAEEDTPSLESDEISSKLDKLKLITADLHTNEELSSLAELLKLELEYLRGESRSSSAQFESKLVVGPAFDDNVQIQAKRHSERFIVLTSSTQLKVEPRKSKRYRKADAARPFPAPFVSAPILFDPWTELKRKIAAQFRVDISDLRLYYQDEEPHIHPIAISVYVARLVRNFNIEVFFFCRHY